MDSKKYGCMYHNLVVIYYKGIVD
jgi:hypothetical protein